MPEYLAPRRRRGPDRGRDRHLEGQGRRHRRDQRHRLRDRDRQVDRRAALAVRRRRLGDPGARGRDGPGRHADHRDRRRRGGRGARLRPRRSPLQPPRWRSTCPTRPPPARARATVPGRPDEGRPRPDPARAQGRLRQRGRRTCRPRRAFETGLASPLVEAAEPEPAVPARSQQPPSRWSPPPLRVLAKPPVRKLAKDLGVDLATLDADRPERHDHPRATSRRAATRWLRRGDRAGQRQPRSPDVERRARDPRADQGRPQDDGRRDGAVGVHGAARHRVGDRRRDPHHGVRRAAQGPPRVPRREGLAAAGARAGRDARDAPYAGGQLVLGRGGAGDRAQALRQPRHRRGHPARPGRPEHQGRPGPLAARAGHARWAS